MSNPNDNKKDKDPDKSGTPAPEGTGGSPPPAGGGAPPKEGPNPKTPPKKRSEKPSNKGKSGGKDPKGGKPTYGPKPVTWPAEYASVALHPVEHGLARAYTGSGNIKIRKAAKFQLNLVAPTDDDNQFSVGARNAFKVLKSLTSGARFYTEYTLYAFRYNMRPLVAILARYTGMLEALKTTLEVSNGPNIAAWQLIQSVSDSRAQYVNVIDLLPNLEKKLDSMITELNSLPCPSNGGLEELFDYFSHIYKDDHGKISDYYVFEPKFLSYVEYYEGLASDDPNYQYNQKLKAILSPDVSDTNGMFSQLYSTFMTIISVIRNSHDMNNLLSDLINAFPSSMRDWAPVVNKHRSTFIRDVGEIMGSRLTSMKLAVGDLVNTGVLDGDHRLVKFLNSSLPAAPAGVTRHDAGTVYVNTFGKASEMECYPLVWESYENGTYGKVATTGLVVSDVLFLDGLGSITTPSIWASWNGIQADLVETDQTKAEEAGKNVCRFWVPMRYLPQADLARYGVSSSGDSVIWNSELLHRCPQDDCVNNIKVINLVAFSTVHMTTEKQR